jgi:hypothetical protein
MYQRRGGSNATGSMTATPIVDLKESREEIRTLSLWPDLPFLAGQTRHPDFKLRGEQGLAFEPWLEGDKVTGSNGIHICVWRCGFA